MRNISYTVAMLMTDDALLEQIDAFLSATGMKPTRFGMEALGEGGLVKSLREGRSPSLKNAKRIVEFMATYRPDQSAAA